MFKNAGFKCIETGLQHGTITVVSKSWPFELTTLRKDLETDGRHAVVSYTDSFELDSNRRDFTMNALYEDIQGKIYDFHLGLQDIQNKILRFVGDPKQRIQEDYLRIMRFFRFKAQFNLGYDSELQEILLEQSPGLLQISQERITTEIKKMFNVEEVLPTLQLMQASGILKIVFPFLQIDPCKKSVDTLISQVLSSHRAVARFAFMILTPEIQRSKREISKICHNLRLSKEDTEIIVRTIKLGEFLEEATLSDVAKSMNFLDNLEKNLNPTNLFLKMFLPVWKIIYPEKLTLLNKLESIELTKGHIRKQKMPISGKDLQEIGVDPGSLMGDALTFLLESFRKELWQTKEHGLLYFSENFKTGVIS